MHLAARSTLLTAAFLSLWAHACAAKAVEKCEKFPGENAGVKISACVSALPPSGGTADARGLTGQQSITTDIFKNTSKPGKLLLGHAEYVLSGKAACFSVPSNWTIEGARGYGTVFSGTGYCKGFNNRTVLTTGSHVVLDAFTVQGSNALGEQCVAMLNGAHDITVHRLQLSGCGQFGILVGDTVQTGGFRNIQITDNEITDVGEATSETNIGIEVFPKGPPGFLAHGLVVQGNTVTGKTGMKLACGIKMSASDHPIIKNNVVDFRAIMATPLSGGGICVVASVGAVIAHNRVLGAKNGIAISGIIDPRNGLRNAVMDVERNYLTDQTQNGIYSAEGFAGLTISHNTLRKASGNAVRGIWLQKRANSYQGAEITDNEITSYPIAIVVDAAGASAKPLITGNKTSGEVIVK